MKAKAPYSDLHCGQAADYLRNRASEHRLATHYQTGVILGSGLGAAAQHVLEAGGVAISFNDIPHMPLPAVEGHAGQLVFGAGELAGIILLQGRVHYYEGHDLAALTFATRVLDELGVVCLIVTNAAGGIRAGFQPGDLMLIEGHWSALQTQMTSPCARETSAWTHMWNRELLTTASAVKTSLNVHRGVYAMMSGPNYETPAEVRMLSRLNVDAVGMSTVPEASAAANLGIDVLGVSCITNIACGLSDTPLDHTEVSETAAGIEVEFSAWLLNLLQKITPDQ